MPAVLPLYAARGLAHDRRLGEPDDLDQYVGVDLARQAGRALLFGGAQTGAAKGAATYARTYGKGMFLRGLTRVGYRLGSVAIGAASGPVGIVATFMDYACS